MKKSIWILLFTMSSVLHVRAKADVEAVIVQVNKSVSLSKKAPTYRNYIINGGVNLGLESGVLVNVLRRMPIHDPILNKAIGDLRIKVAELEVIHSEANISVARLHYLESPAERPVLSFEGVMVGDRLDLNSIRPKESVFIHRPVEEQVASSTP